MDVREQRTEVGGRRCPPERYGSESGGFSLEREVEVYGGGGRGIFGCVKKNVYLCGIICGLLMVTCLLIICYVPRMAQASVEAAYCFMTIDTIN